MICGLGDKREHLEQYHFENCDELPQVQPTNAHYGHSNANHSEAAWKDQLVKSIEI